MKQKKEDKENQEELGCCPMMFSAYKKFKDPALVGSMSGHVDGSRSFARYRDIDLDIKKEVVKELE